MNDLLEAKNGAGIFNPLDALRKIEVIKGEIPHAIKNFKAEVAEFSSMDRKLSSLKAKAHKKAKIKTLEKIEAFEDEYRCEYEKCKSSLADIENLLEEISILYLNLAEYYSSYGKGKSAKKNRKSAEKFDKAARKQLDPLVAILNSANELSEIELQEEADEEFKVPEEKNCENSATEEKANCSSDSDERVRRDERVDREYNNPYHYIT